MSVPMSSEAWLRQLNAITDTYKLTKQPPYVFNRVTRTTCCVLAPIACAPCIIWSLSWRVVFCPFLCAFKGPANMCGGSGCTDVTDTCITSCYNELDNVTRLPPIPKKEYWTEEQKNKLANALYDLETIFSQKAKYNKQLYGFAYACFRCLPFEVPAIIAGIRNSIIHNIHTEHPTRNYLD